MTIIAGYDTRMHLPESLRYLEDSLIFYTGFDKFDTPYNRGYGIDYTGHLGQVGTISGGECGFGMFDSYVLGKYGKSFVCGPATTNLVENPSFETDTNGWIIAGAGTTLTRTYEHALYGSYSLKINTIAAGRGVNFIWGGARMAFPPNTYYNGNVWVKPSAGMVGGSMRMTIREYTAGGAYINTGMTTVTMTAAMVGTWTRIAVHRQSAANCASLDIFVYNQTGFGTSYIDGVSLYQSIGGGAYLYSQNHIDGSLGPGYSWAGVAHASESSRAATQLSYSEAGIPIGQVGTIMLWGKFYTDQPASTEYAINIPGTAGQIRIYKTNNTYASWGNGDPTIALGHTTGAWQHWAITNNVNGVMNGYRNGAPIIVNNPGHTGFVNNPAGTAYIGCNGAANWYEGMLDEVAIFDRVLTPAEILAIYNLGSPLLSLDYEPTCDDKIFTVNHQRIGNITHAYFYDASAATYSANLIDEIAPMALLPNPVAANDALYIGCDSGLVNGSPFSNVIFNITAPGAGLTSGNWEYYSSAGPGWRDIVADVPTRFFDNTNNLQTAGCNVLSFQPPPNWTTLSINGVTAYWIRNVMTGVVGVPIPPVQIERSIYCCNTPWIEILEGDTGGDIAAMLKAEMEVVGQSIHGVCAGLRSVERGSNFWAYLNLSDEQNPANVLVSNIDPLAAFANYMDSPTGRAIQITAPGAAYTYFTNLFNVNITDTLAAEYTGEYRILVRAESEPNWIFRAALSCGSLNNYAWYSEERCGTTDGYSPGGTFDFGKLVIPEGYEDIYLTIQGRTNSLTGALPTTTYFFDYVLIPADEMYIEVREVNFDAVPSELGAHIIADNTQGSQRTYTGYIDSSDASIRQWSTKVYPSLQIQANKDQRLWFHYLNPYYSGSVWYAYHDHITVSRKQLFHAKRYLSMRGNQ